VSCQCPDGSTHEVFEKLKEKKEKLKSKILDKSPCGAGVEPTECTCENGETLATGSSSEPLNPCAGPPSSCTCPDGETFDGNTLREILKALVY
jgi:hypothetical protein